MKGLKILFFVFCFFLYYEIIPQSFQGSIIIESAAMINKKHQDNFFYMESNGIINTEFSSEEKRLILSGYGVYYSAKLSVGKQIQLEIRPGYFFSEKIFEGVQTGIYLRYLFPKGYYGIFGFTTELHSGGGGNSYNPTQHTFTTGLSIGKMINSKFSALLSVNKTLTEYAGSNRTNFSNPNWVLYQYLYWIIKIGVELNI